MNGSTASGSAADRVLGLFEGARLTPTQRRIAHALIQHAAATPFLSAAEVAELAGVSQPSVTRFAVALGHAGYLALRRELRDVVGPAGAAPDGPAEESPAQRALRGSAEMLQGLADQYGPAGGGSRAVAEAARLLAASRPLPVLGLRAAGPTAAYFGYFASKIHSDVRVLDSGGSQLADRLDQARAAGAGAMLAVVLPRYPREALDAVREARAAGLGVVALTDSPVSPAAEHADVVLSAAVGTQLVFDLHTGPIAVAMVLLQAMCDAAPDAVQRRLEEFEQIAARRQIFAP